MGKTKDIRQAVEDELVFDPLVDSPGMRVENLGGDVAQASPGVLPAALR
jgi:hypothetical protein